ncbi:MAG: 7-cyano-7-deazaguanine synthase QueC [Clostridia bacterium]|nr:7-cyano-7-deazaguanine synthase QueC [Deltaproteobacteria bacterium]
MSPRKPCVVLLSGGLDSATCLAMAQDQGFMVHALTIAYGQRHAVETQAARKLTKKHNVTDHRVVTIDLRAFGGSALTADIDVPKGRSDDAMRHGVPVTYVPARNTIFLSYALGFAEVVGAFDIFTGVNAVDYSGYPDCRPVFIEQFQKLADVATAAQGRYTIHAPLIALSKGDIIREGMKLGVDYGLTHSCYDPVNDLACGHCDSCHIRSQGFKAAGAPDPTRYVNR